MKKKVLCVILTGMIMSVLAGCGDDEPDTSVAAQIMERLDAEAPAAEEEAKQKEAALAEEAPAEEEPEEEPADEEIAADVAADIDYAGLFREYVEAIKESDEVNSLDLDAGSLYAEIIYFNDDDIPDVVFTNAKRGDSYGYTYITVKSGDKLDTLFSLVPAGNMSYIPRRSLLRENGGGGGEYWCDVISYGSGDSDCVFSGSSSLEYLDDGTETGTYYFESEEVSEKEYNNHLNEVFPLDEEKYFNCVTTMEEIEELFEEGKVPAYDPDAEWKTVYRNLVSDIFVGKELLHEGEDVFGYDEGMDTMSFDLFDITGDEIPELFITPSMRNPSWSVYTVRNGAYEMIDLGDEFYIEKYDRENKLLYAVRNMSENDMFGKNISENSMMCIYDTGVDGVNCACSLYTDRNEDGVLCYCLNDGEDLYLLSKEEWDGYWENVAWGSDLFLNLLSVDKLEKYL